jgi:hypothetical protein
VAELQAERIFAALYDHGVRYVLIGGLAGVVQGSPSLTEDADILPDMAEDNLERLADCLRELEARLRIPGELDGVPFDPHPALLRQMSSLTMVTAFGDLDLVISPAGLDDYASVLKNAVEISIDGIPVPTASLDDVIHSKETANRPKDHLSLPYLRALRDEIARRDGTAR